VTLSDPIELDEAPAPPAPRVTGVGLLARLASSEPVRLWLYPVVVAGVALLVAYGLVAPDVEPLWTSLAAALLGVGGPALVERLRAGVVSPKTHRATGGQL
jgi:hypothetical protein